MYGTTEKMLLLPGDDEDGSPTSDSAKQSGLLRRRIVLLSIQSGRAKVRPGVQTGVTF